jgi:hypothetical protein
VLHTQLDADWRLLRAALTVVDPTTDPPELDFAATMQLISTGDAFAIYGRWNGTPVTPIEFTEAPVAHEEQDWHVPGMVHHGGVSYLFVGDALAPMGTRLYTFVQPVSPPLQAQLVGPTETFIATVSAEPDGMNIAAATTSPVLQLLAGKVAYADLDSLQLADLPVAETLQVIDETPFGEASTMAWMGDIATVLGKKFSYPTEMAYRFYDAAANVRGWGDLPFLGDLGNFNRVQILSVAGAASDPLFDTIGGELPVLWLEAQSDGTNDRQVLYFNELSCRLDDGS